MATIRAATGADIPGMVALLGLLFTIEEDFAFAPDRQRRGLELLLAADRALVLVAEDQGEVIGMATGQLVISTAEGALSLTIEDVVVAPDRRSRGIGSALLDNLAGWGRQQGAGRMQLLADRTNHSALGFYRGQDWLTTRLICLRKYSTGNER